ncbi:MAG TPA: hypothetical protein VFG20_02980, partial [Planctomycetaceae bacterium]|nr:hypothetical protein [Planctomycetaceae bacterium]
WAAGLLVIAWLGMYVDAGEAWAARWQKGVGVIAYPRRQHALFQAALQRDVTRRPALVLVDGPHDGQQLDYVTNHAGLNAPVIIGRDRRGPASWEEIAAAFPRRSLYHFRMDVGRAELISPASK